MWQRFCSIQSCDRQEHDELGGRFRVHHSLAVSGGPLPFSFKVGVTILAVYLVIAAIGPFIAPYGGTEIGTGPPVSGMSLQHPMGVDQIGRDVFSRVLHGAHVVILLSLAGTALGLALGSLVGLLSAYIGGLFDEVVQRIIEAFVSIPYIVLGLLAVYAAGRSWLASRRS